MMERRFKILPGKYVVVKYNYKPDIIIPGTTGKQEMFYMIKVDNFHEDTIKDAAMKFALHAADLPHSEHIQVLEILFQEIKETFLN